MCIRKIMREAHLHKIGYYRRIRLIGGDLKVTKEMFEELPSWVEILKNKLDGR